MYIGKRNPKYKNLNIRSVISSIRKVFWSLKSNESMRINAIDFMLKLNSNNEFSLDERNIGNNL